MGRQTFLDFGMIPALAKLVSPVVRILLVTCALGNWSVLLLGYY